MNVIEWHQPAPLTGEALITALREVLRGRVIEAYLFGSHARGTATTDSDIDLILVQATQAPFLERFADFHDVVSRFAPIDLIVYTPEEWARVQMQGGYVATMLAQRKRVI